MQVVTSENFQQLIETGKVPEFKPPESESAKVSVDDAKAPDDSKKELPRDEHGKFTKASDTDKSDTAATRAADDEGGDDLPERARKVIGKKHRLMKEAEEFGRQQYLERKAAEQRAADLEQRLKENEAKSRPAQSKEDSPPKPEGFATIAEYTDALTDHKVAKKFEAEKLRQEQERQAEEKATRERQFVQRVAEAKKEFPDFEEVMDRIKGTELDRVPVDVEEYLQESEFGPKLLYTLGTNPETLDRLRKLSPRRFIAELGKLETKFEKSEAIPATSSLTTIPAVSKAPAPIAPLEAKSTPVQKDPAKMSFQELREYDRQQRLARAR